MAEVDKGPGYVDSDYLETIAKISKPFKDRSYESMRIEDGDRILDVGCGPGIDIIALARTVGPSGKVYGIDHDAEMIARANENAVAAGVSDRVVPVEGDALSLPYDSDYFHSCRSERLFQHVSEPERILSEMVRVTRPGGLIVVLDTDHSSVSTDSPYTDLEWRLRRFRTDRFINGYAGRQLYRLFKEQGLTDIVVEFLPIFVTDYALGRYMTLMDETEQEALSAGIVTEKELQASHEKFWQGDEKGTFFGYGIEIMVAGRKP